MHLSSPPYAVHAPPISHFSYLITWIIFSEEYRSLSTSLCNFLYSRYLVPLRPKYAPEQTIRQKILQRMIASIPWLQSALNFFLNNSWFIRVVPKYLNCSTLSKKLLTIFILWLHLAFCSSERYLDLSAFTSSPLFLTATTEASVFFFIMWMCLPNTLTSSA